MFRSDQVILNSQKRARVNSDTLARRWKRTGRSHYRAGMGASKHQFGGSSLLCQNLIAEGENAIWKCFPGGFEILPCLIASVQRDSSRQHELNIRLLIGEKPLNIPRVEGR